MQSYLVNTTLEQVAYSKDLPKPPLLPTYKSLPAHCPAIFEPEMEAIKSMLDDTCEEEKTRWPAPERRTWLSAPIPLHEVQVHTPGPLNVDRLISGNLTKSKERVLSGGRQRPGDKGRDGISLSSKSGVENVWPLGPTKSTAGGTQDSVNLGAF